MRVWEIKVVRQRCIVALLMQLIMVLLSHVRMQGWANADARQFAWDAFGWGEEPAAEIQLYP